MKCPICGSESLELLKSKKETSKTKEINKLLFKCKECETVFKEVVTNERPVDYRVIISEHEKSRKAFVKLYPDEKLSVGDIMSVEGSEVEITSLENKKSGRVDKGLAADIVTIWASSRDIPARVGVSIDFKGIIVSNKVDIDRGFKFTVGDVVKIEKYIFKINSIKTTDKKIRKGYEIASNIKRVYGRPIESYKRYNYDLTKKIVHLDKKEEE